MPSTELRRRASILADWADDGPGFWPIYLFGSRVRGDHRADSDVDVRVFVDRYKGDEESGRWWGQQNAGDFAELERRLPGPLSLHADTDDNADPAIIVGSKRAGRRSELDRGG